MHPIECLISAMESNRNNDNFEALSLLTKAIGANKTTKIMEANMGNLLDRQNISYQKITLPLVIKNTRSIKNDGRHSL